MAQFPSRRKVHRWSFPLFIWIKSNSSNRRERTWNIGTRILVRSTQPRHALPSCRFEFFHCFVKPRMFARRPVRPPVPVSAVIDQLDIASIFVNSICASKKLDDRLAIGAVDYLHNIGVYVFFQNRIPSGPCPTVQDCARTSFAQ